MRMIPIHVDTAVFGAIGLGKQGEKNATRVRFYAPSWYAEYPGAEYQLFVTPPGEATPYLAQIEIEAGTVTWDLQEADTAIPGSGTLELILTDGETKIKSVTYRTWLDKSPSSQEPGNAPDVHPTWWENAIKKIEAATTEAIGEIDGAFEAEKQEATAAIVKAAEDAIASIPADYTELAGDVSTLKDATGYEETANATPDIYSAGKYVSKGGALSTSSSFNVYGPIRLLKGDMIKFNARGYSTNVSILAKKDDNLDIFTSVIVSTDSVAHDFEYKVDETGLYVISSNASVAVAYEIISSALLVRVDEVERFTKTFDPLIEFGSPNTISGQYVNTGGTLSKFSGFSTTEPVFIPAGYRLKVVMSVSDAGSLAVISEYDPAYATYTPLVKWADDVTEFEYIFDKPSYVVVSFRDANGYSAEMTRNYNALARWASSQTDVAADSVLSAFNSIVCIGDSLTYSAVYTGSTTNRQAYQPYPKVLEKRTGTPTEMFARSGATTTSWWSEFNAECFVERKNACYIVYLGTNDGMTDTVEADCPADADMSAWANTHTGYYGRILQSIANLGARAILVKLYSTEGNLGVTNSVIEQFGKRFSFPVVENKKLNGVVYNYYPDKTGTGGAHYNDLGYAVFTDQLIKNIGALNAEQLAMLIPN